jgi:ribosome-associated translation inhibitor RaiA
MKEELLVEIKRLKIEGENFFCISNHDEMRPFFMSVVSDSNHWIFISSNGGISAGRKSAEYSLFPYYTADKITESYDNTGSKSIFQIIVNDEIHIWEPFSERNNSLYDISRNLYKNAIGNKIIFEEINHNFGLTFRYEWNTSNIYGFVRKSSLENKGDKNLQINILDGIQNIMPDGVSSDLQNSTSILVDAYKRNELDLNSGLGIFALSAIIVDKAEPSEALKANVAWSLGLDKPLHLLSSLQLNTFRDGLKVVQEEDVKAEKGSYFINKEINLSPGEKKKWLIVADVNQSQADVVSIINAIETNKQIQTLIEDDIILGSKLLNELNASSDGIQLSTDVYRDTRHFSNTLFNIMRGGIFDFNYQIEKNDLINYLAGANKVVFENHKQLLDNLADTFTVFELENIYAKVEDKNFKRLCTEYLPLKFSRRHGDPSRPWNKFSINTRSAVDYSKKILDYEGNWRDIFQNWEALAISYPGFTRSMIHKFLNATTFEGYNPYRVTKGGFDWETVEPDNPWSYIGYWGDHQIIYLLKLLEINEKYFPGQLSSQFNEEQFVYANVPYKIKNYREILKNAKDTIEFDEHLDAEIKNNIQILGSDAALLVDQHQKIYTVNFIEKILATVLAKLSNFIPGAGIWMNTQRPEWNDANNALVGNGVSMVTLYYLRRFLVFFEKLVEQTDEERIELSNELIIFLKAIHATLDENTGLLNGEINDVQRKAILDNLGEAGSEYREHIYKQSFWSEKRTISYRRLKAFVKVSLAFVEHTINANKREDDMYHAYNLMSIKSEQEVSISYLSEMLEGQVAVLSSGYLSPQNAIKLLDSMKNSALFRPDQYSYLLYPNKQLPKFLQKNKIPNDAINKFKLIDILLADGEKSIVEKDINGEYHFNGNLKNAGDLSNAIDQLDSSKYGTYIQTEKRALLDTYEVVFDHKSFTGRSGTFYGYEGLGSIYWHMVSKLQLAVQEVCLQAIESGESGEVIGKLLEHYYEINAGVGVHKSPKLYGAFPTDPYSHTPSNKGAQQPGMTGQVKEDIISRFGELGVFVLNGALYFNPCLLRKDEFTKEDRVFHYVTINKEHKTFAPMPGSLCFTYCQVPIIYRISVDNHLEIEKKDGSITKENSLQLDVKTSLEIFNRTGEISRITVYIKESILK